LRQSTEHTAQIHLFVVLPGSRLFGREAHNVTALGIEVHGVQLIRAEQTGSIISDRFPDAQVIIADIGPIIGAHAGPGVLALIYFGNNR